MQISATQRLMLIMDEIAIAKGKLRPEDTGHIHTTINVLEGRVQEITEKLSKELDKHE